MPFRCVSWYIFHVCCYTFTRFFLHLTYVFKTFGVIYIFRNRCYIFHMCWYIFQKEYILYFFIFRFFFHIYNVCLHNVELVHVDIVCFHVYARIILTLIYPSGTPRITFYYLRLKAKRLVFWQYLPLSDIRYQGTKENLN